MTNPIILRAQLHSLEGPTLAAASARWERRNGSSDGIVANVQTTLYAAHKGRIKARLVHSLHRGGCVDPPDSRDLETGCPQESSLYFCRASQVWSACMLPKLGFDYFSCSLHA